MKFWKYFVLGSSKDCFPLLLKPNAADMLTGGGALADGCQVWSAKVLEASLQQPLHCSWDVWWIETPQSHFLLSLQTCHMPSSAADPGSHGSWPRALLLIRFCQRTTNLQDCQESFSLWMAKVSRIKNISTKHIVFDVPPLINFQFLTS